MCCEGLKQTRSDYTCVQKLRGQWIILGGNSDLDFANILTLKYIAKFYYKNIKIKWFKQVSQ